MNFILLYHYDTTAYGTIKCCVPNCSHTKTKAIHDLTLSIISTLTKHLANPLGFSYHFDY